MRQSLFASTGNLIQWQEIFICTYQIWFLLQYNRKWKSQGIQSCKDWRKPWLTYFSTSWNFNYFKLWKEVNERVLGKKNVCQFSFNKKKYENLTLRRERENYGEVLTCTPDLSSSSFFLDLDFSKLLILSSLILSVSATI